MVSFFSALGQIQGHNVQHLLLTFEPFIEWRLGSKTFRHPATYILCTWRNIFSTYGDFKYSFLIKWRLWATFSPAKTRFRCFTCRFDSSLWGFPHLYQPHSHCFYTNVLTVLFSICSVYLRPSLWACLDVRNQQGLFFFFVCLIFTSQVLTLTFLFCCVVYIIACCLHYNIWSTFPHFSHRFSSLLPRFWWFISWTICDKSVARHGKIMG